MLTYCHRFLQNAMAAPHWNINAHSLSYVTKGSGRLTIVGNNGKAAFDGQLQEGQLILVPQNFVVMTQASDEGYEWIAFKTNDQAQIAAVAGPSAVIRGIPEEVLMNSYQLSRDEARRLKYNREEATILTRPRSASQGRFSAWSIAE